VTRRGGREFVDTNVLVTLTRKVPSPLHSREAERLVEGFSHWTLHEPKPEDLLAAIQIHATARVSLRDALGLQSARRRGFEVSRFRLSGEPNPSGRGAGDGTARAASPVQATVRGS